MLSEIGSDFWQCSFNLPNREKKLWWESEDYYRVFFKSGRNAIKALAHLLKREGTRVLLPAYTCETVILPFLAEGFEIGYYGIKTDMSINIESLLSLIKSFEPNAILFHSYFGFDTLSVDSNVIKDIHGKGITIIEDITQSVFSNHFLECADYYVSSLRKFLAIPDGGVLFSKKKFNVTGVVSPDRTLISTAVEAFDQKKEYITVSQDELLKESFRERYVRLNQLIADNEFLRYINPESLQIFQSCDIDDISSKRCENYRRLKSVIYETDSITSAIPDQLNGAVPLYFPIYVDGNRKQLQEYLAQNKVYCPVIWPRPSQVSCESEAVDYMYSHMLCIPIDQRYGKAEIDKIEWLLREYREEGAR